MNDAALTNKYNKPEPVPPGRYAKTAEHHWLDVYDGDDHFFGMVVLQWNPGAKRWSHSGNVGTGIYVDTRCWRYVDFCPMPVGRSDISADLKQKTVAVVEEVRRREATCIHDVKLTHYCPRCGANEMKE